MFDMNRSRRVNVLGALLVASMIASIPAIADSGKWIHVRVEESGGSAEKVSVNIPFDLLTQMLPLISIDELQGGRLQLDDELEGIDLRELAAALRDAPDAEFVTVESDDETVRISKEGEFLVVRVEERGKHSREKVRVRVPLAVFDALFGGDENELDLLAALEVLGQYEGEALIDVESDDTSVRVWIDSSENGR